MVETKYELENIVIDHSKQSNAEVSKILDQFEEKIREQEEVDIEDDLPENQLLPPHDVNKLWPWLSLSQLKNRPMQVNLPPAGKHNLSQQIPPSLLLSPTKSPRFSTATASPHKFNRAVSGFRTPKKATDKLLEDDFDLLDFCDNSDVSLINEILQSSDFSKELDSFREERSGEVKVCRNWFNANKRFKVREVMTQTTQFYDGVQIASDNVYTQFKGPSPDRDKRKQVMSYRVEEKTNSSSTERSYDFQAVSNQTPTAYKENIPVGRVQLPTMHMPTMQIPTMQVPTMHVSTMQVPTIQIPSMHVQTIQAPTIDLPTPTQPHRYQTIVQLPNYPQLQLQSTTHKHLPTMELPPVRKQFFSGSSVAKTYSYKYDPRHRMEVQGRTPQRVPPPSSQSRSAEEMLSSCSSMLGVLPVVTTQPHDPMARNIPQFDGLGEDDIIKLLDESHDDIKVEDESDEEIKVEDDTDEEIRVEDEFSDSQLNVDQLDGATEDAKEDPKPAGPDKLKVEDVKMEPHTVTQQGMILLHSTLGNTQASPGSSRGPTPARTPVTPSNPATPSPSPSIEGPLLCSDCGNSYGSRKSYDAHISGCAAMVRLMEKREGQGEKQKDKHNTPVPSPMGSPKKASNFSIMGLLTKEEKDVDVKPSVGDDDIMILSESITQQLPKLPPAKRAIMRPPSQPKPAQKPPTPVQFSNAGPQYSQYSAPTNSTAQQYSQYSGVTSTAAQAYSQYSSVTSTGAQQYSSVISTAAQQYSQYNAAPTAIQPQQLGQTLGQSYPYPSTVIQYPYGYPGVVGLPTMGLSTLQQPMLGGYITLPGVQPVIQQPIYYNPTPGLQYSMRPGLAPSSFLAPTLQQPYPGAMVAQQQQQQLIQPQPSLQQSPQLPAQQFSTYQRPSSQPARPASVVHISPQPEPPKLQPVVSAAPAQPPPAFPTQPNSAPPPRKIARVQPTPHIVRPIPTKAPLAPPPAHRFGGAQLQSPSPTHPKPPVLSPAHTKDPMMALASLSQKPLVKPQELATDLSVTKKAPQPPKPYIQPRVGPYRPYIPTPQPTVIPKQEVIEVESKPASPALSGHAYSCSSPEPDTFTRKGLEGVHVTTKASKTNSIKLVMQRDRSDSYNITEMMIKDGSMGKHSIDTKTAIQALKAKTKIARKQKVKEAFRVPLDTDGSFQLNAQNTFVNEVDAEEDSSSTPSSSAVPPEYGSSAPSTSSSKPKTGAHIMYKLFSEDGGFSAESADITSLWRMVFDAVSSARASQKLATPPTGLVPSGEQMLGLTHSALRYLLEQFPGSRSCSKAYEWKHQEPPEPVEDIKENPTGSARSEPFTGRKDRDMFAWLASKHRKMPHPNVGFKLPPEMAAEAHLMGTSQRRATSLDLPMAMRFRHLAKNAREAVGVYCSGIHGVGLFCKREIQGGEMVMEYAGEEIRAMLTDKREAFYDSKGIGCYMFRVDDDFVIDATLKGNSARFINHSCDVSFRFNFFVI